MNLESAKHKEVFERSLFKVSREIKKNEKSFGEKTDVRKID